MNLYACPDYSIRSAHTTRNYLWSGDYDHLIVSSSWSSSSSWWAYADSLSMAGPARPSFISWPLTCLLSCGYNISVWPLKRSHTHTHTHTHTDQLCPIISVIYSQVGGYVAHRHEYTRDKTNNYHIIRIATRRQFSVGQVLHKNDHHGSSEYKLTTTTKCRCLVLVHTKCHLSSAQI